jgi:hypothetical protein
MASISFNPTLSGQAAIQNADFENGFTISQNQNTFNFNGSWICPVNPIPATYTQNMICVCEKTGDCAAITATFTFDGNNANVTGSMTLSNPSSNFGASGIASIAGNTGTTSVFLAGSTAPNSYISAPYLSGHMGESSF